MHADRRSPRAVLISLIIAIVVAVGTSSFRQIGGSGRLIAFNGFPEPDSMTCEWDGGAGQPEQPTLMDKAGRLFFQRPGSGGAQVDPAAAAIKNATSTREPLRFIQDPYGAFSSVVVDTARNEVIFTDENRFRVFVYDRLA